MGTREVVVLDTNVLVSALGWRGPEDRIYRMCRGRILQMATSHALLIELGRALRYRKLGFESAEIASFLSDICRHAVIVVPTDVVSVVRDPADDRLLECAIEATASWIITGDKDLLDLGQFRHVRIASAREFLDLE